ncbi:uncharacterized protein [Primulina huaijiensis]|uniref:uncharacterized protein n=1 Tax=Primulina huaijiensis TaxID=1492673 RepID=UPI003CC75182
MVKWTIELEEYDIEYKPRIAIKAQALTDFLIELIQPGEEEVWRAFVDGASNLSGCEVGVVLIAPSGEKIKLALRIDSMVTKNEAEYDVVLAELQAVEEVGAYRVIIYSDSQLVTQQIKGTYEAKNEKMLKYLALIKARAAALTDWSIEQIPRKENGEADTLAKLAASMSDISTREVLCFTRLVLSVDEEVPLIQRNSWMTPLIKYIVHGKLAEDRARAVKIKKQAPRFVFSNDVLYRRSYQGPLLKCLSENEVEYVLREIHEGCCCEHLGGTALSRKAILAGFWWPQINQDAARLVQKCKGCQHHYNFQHRPAADMQPVSASCPFDQWGLDIVGPFPIARAQKKFFLVAVDYFSKRVEAEPLAKIAEEKSWAIELDLVEERRDRAAIRMEAFRSRIMKSYNNHVRSRDFQVGDLVMKKIKPVGDVGKLESRWEGPFKVIQRVSSGAAYYLEDSQGRALKRPWNAFHLKKYYV